MPARHPESDSSPRFYRFGDFELDLLEESLRREGDRLNINHRTFQVLRLLIERRGDIVTKEEFFTEVWEGTFVEDNNLSVTMTALRKILGDSARDARFIENLPRKGYRFVAPVTVGAGNFSDRGAIAAKPFGSFAIGAVGVGLIVLLSIAAVGYKRFWPSRAISVNKTDSVAILPFESRNSDSEYLADGLTDAVINDVSRFSHIRVIDRNAAYRYKNKPSDPATAGRELNVRAIVTGQAELVDNTLVVTAELTELANNSQLWRLQFRRPMSDLISVQKEISEAVAKNLRADETGPEQSRFSKRPTNDPEAYDLYLKGRYLWNKRGNQDFIKAIELFRAAIDRDPTFAKAYVGLAEAYTLGDLTPLGVRNEDRLALARGAAQRALEIDDTIGEVYATTAINKCYIEWDFAGSESDYRRALELNPNDATAHHWYAESLAMQGRFDESLAEYERAMSLDPLSLPIRTDMALTYYYSRDFDTAIELLSSAREIDPRYGRTYEFLMFPYREKGMWS